MSASIYAKSNGTQAALQINGVDSIVFDSTGVVSGVATGFGNVQVFTASGTFTVPAGITKVKVTVVGGGGGGTTAGAGCGYWYCGTGGGGGGSTQKIVSGLTPGGTIAVTVGAAGPAAGSGGTSSFGAHCSATGGGPGTTGVGTGGHINLTGGPATLGGGFRLYTHQAAFGGGSLLAQISIGRAVGNGYGGGGGGGTDGAGVVGAAGAAGVVIVEY